MRYYSHDIKTFNSATQYLTHVERALYRCLIEIYYDTEAAIPATDFERLARRVRAVTDGERSALLTVLDEFFERTGDVYTHHYCEEQIEKYHKNQSDKALAGKASAAARRVRADERRAQRSPTAVEQPLNSGSTGVEQKPNGSPTEPQLICKAVNTESSKEEKKDITRAPRTTALRPPEIPEQLWTDFLSLRKQRKAPLTASALAGIEREAAKAGITLAEALAECCARGWQGFKADWYAREIKRPEKKTNVDLMRDTVQRIASRMYANASPEEKAEYEAEMQAKNGGNLVCLPLQKT